MSELVRYSFIKEKFPREFLLLQGTGCIYKKCRFCDYYNDRSADPFGVNKDVIARITGLTGTIDVINSGSCFELDSETLALLYKKALEKNIHTIWFEAHFLYHRKLDEFRKNFPGISIKFRTGVETFNPELRAQWCKGISKDVTASDLSKFFNGVCLLVGVEGQTREDIVNDIKLAERFFEYFSVNVFVENTTNVKRDKELVEWFETVIYPEVRNNKKIEILLNNKDLGVG